MGLTNREAYVRTTKTLTNLLTDAVVRLIYSQTTHLNRTETLQRNVTIRGNRCLVRLL